MTPRARRYLVLVLAVCSGATDAIGFLALGGAFTSVMTGNLVLLGVASVNADLAMALHTISAIGGFVVGAWLGARVAAGTREGDDPTWPGGITRALGLEFALFATFAVYWWILDGRPEPEWRWFALMVNASALGIQSSAIQRLGVPGLSTTYLTGTLTTVVAELATGKGVRRVRYSISLLVALVLGAAMGALLVSRAPVGVPVLQVGPVFVVLVSLVLLRRCSVRRRG